MNIDIDEYYLAAISLITDKSRQGSMIFHKASYFKAAVVKLGTYGSYIDAVTDKIYDYDINCFSKVGELIIDPRFRLIPFRLFLINQYDALNEKQFLKMAKTINKICSEQLENYRVIKNINNNELDFETYDDLNSDIYDCYKKSKPKIMKKIKKFDFLILNK